MDKFKFFEDIESDADLVNVIDELKHRIKGGIRKNGSYTDMQKDFNNALNEIICKHKLDNDPHMFATLPNEDIN